MEWKHKPVARAIGDYVETLVLERPFEFAVLVMIGVAWRWFIGRNFQKRFDTQKDLSDALCTTVEAQNSRIETLERRLELPSAQPPPPHSFSTVVEGDIVQGDKHTHIMANEGVTDEKMRVMHYGTKHGDLTVRFHSVREAAQDIQDWLLANKLNASVSGPTLKAVIKRASENKRRK